MEIKIKSRGRHKKLSNYMHADAIRRAGNAQQNFICVILSSRGRRTTQDTEIKASTDKLPKKKGTEWERERDR